MDNVNGKWALVTGASSGFGIEFATLLAEQAANIILAARRTEPMERLAEQLRQKHRVNVVVEGIDLSVVGAGAELKSRLDRRGIAVDVLVNNAGCGLYGNFLAQPLEQIFGMLQRTWWHAGQATSFWLPVCSDMRQPRVTRPMPRVRVTSSCLAKRCMRNSNPTVST